MAEGRRGRKYCVTAIPCWSWRPDAGNGENKLTGRKLSKRNREVFLEGLKRYRDRGIPILIDGKETDASEWGKILEEQPDGSFYMGDYILEEETSEGGREAIVREDSVEYMSGDNQLAGRKLKEIRFDRVYNR